MKRKFTFVNMIVLVILLASSVSPVVEVTTPFPKTSPEGVAPIVPIANTTVQPLPIAARAIQPVQNVSLSDDRVRAPEPPLDDLPPEVAGKREITALRTADSATFDMGDGSFTLVQEARPIHYQDEQGQWRRIDPAFAPVEKGWLNTANSLNTGLATRTSKAILTTAQAGVGWEPRSLQAVDAAGQSVTLATALTDAQAMTGTLSADQRTVRYPGGWSDPALQDQWQSGFGSAEYSLRLASRLDLPGPQDLGGLDSLELRVSLHLLPGTHVQVNDKPVNAADLPLETRQAVSFVNDKGDTLWLQPPRAYEEASRSTSVAGGYKLYAGADAATVELGVRIPWGWLAAAERQFPVVIDPVFQVKSPYHIRTVRYSSGGYTWGELDPDTVALGHQGIDVVDQVLVYLPLPTLPPGATIVSARVEAKPTGAIFLGRPNSGWSTTIEALSLYSSNWMAASHSGSPPLGVSLGSLMMRYSNGQNQPATSWDVTALAEDWRTAPWNNHGFLLRPSGAPCSCQYEYCSGDCGGFVFPRLSEYDPNESAELDLSQGQGGIRLVVQYTGPQLAQNQIINGLTGSGVENPSADPNYYNAVHEYTLTPLPDDRWQAVVARGLGQPYGVDPGQQGQFGQVYTQPLQGSVEMELHGSNETQSPKNGSLSYILLDGRNAAGQPQNRMWIKPQSQEPGVVMPLRYDVRLIGETESINVLLNGPPVVREFTFDSREPMTLWNINLPAGSNSRVDIEIFDHNYRNNEYAPVPGTYELVKRFSAQLFRGWVPAAYWYHPYDRAYIKLANNWQDQSGPIAYGSARLSSGIFYAEPGLFTYALALAYNGPALTFYTCTSGSNEFSCSTWAVAPLRFRYRLRITACDGSKGMFPTKNGTCQYIQCPTAATPHYDTGPWRLWSQEGWDGSAPVVTSTAVFTAPMIGPAGNNAPTVALVGGQIISDTGHVRVNADSSVLLVNCGSLSSHPVTQNDYFQVFSGAMRRFWGMLMPSGMGGEKIFDPWPPLDRDDNNGHHDVSGESFVVLPTDGTARGWATLLRRTGNDLLFQTAYTVTFNGWTSLQSRISQNGTSDPPPIVGLTLDLGSAFRLDTPGSVNKFSTRQFQAVRAISATVTQPANLGGASKIVQALLMKVGDSIPTQTATKQPCPGSCVDLRALDDTLGSPNRVWPMPDIHTNVQPGMVALSTQGKLQVWSADHPAMPAGAQDISQQFSFDTFGASVSIEQGDCAGVTNVTIIRGETRLAIPMIGDGTNPDNVVNAKFTLCQNPADNNNVNLRQVTFEFYSPVGIPIGATGLFVTRMKGNINIYPAHTEITFELDFQASQGGDGGILKGSGQITIDTGGLFDFQGAGKLLHGAVDASGHLWVAWNPLDTGFDMHLEYKLSDEVRLIGQVRAHAWRGRGWQGRYSWLPDNDEPHFAAQIAAQLSVDAGAVMWLVPPCDINIGVEVAFGQFCTNGGCTEYEWGFKAIVTICGFDVGVYYGFDEGLDIILGNDGHVLIDQYGGAAAQSISSLSAEAEPDAVRVQAAPQAVNGVATQMITVTPETENFLLGLSWQAGALQLELYGPGNEKVIARPCVECPPWVFSNVTHTVSISRTSHTYGWLPSWTISSTLVGVRLDPANHPLPGQWRAVISGITDQAHYKFFFLANKGAPGTPDNRGYFLTPGLTRQTVSGVYTITWATPPGTPPSATISLYSTRWESVIGGFSPVTKTQDMPIVRNLPFSRGYYAWDTSGMASGLYTLRAVVDDGVNAFPPGGAASRRSDPCQPGSELPDPRAFDPNRFPGVSIFTSTLPYDSGGLHLGGIVINDAVPPAAPTGLDVTGVDGAILARWNPSPEKDVAAYLVQWGVVYFVAGMPGHWEWEGGAPSQAERVTATYSPTLRIGGLSNTLPSLSSYGVIVSAIDASGNIGPSTPLARATPTSDAALQVPMAPLTPTVTSRSAYSATLEWFRPAGPAPASYRLIYRQPITFAPIAQVDVPAPVLVPLIIHTTITGLQPGATYEAMVSAANSQGWHSAYSPKVRFVATNGVDGDGNGMPDDWESVRLHLPPGIVRPDADFDGLSNVGEYHAGTDPWVQDSDGDEFSDEEEVAAGTDPLDRTSYPAQQTQPRLGLVYHQVTFYAKQGLAAPSPQTVPYYNDGGGTMSLAASTTSPWLGTFVAKDPWFYVLVWVDTSGLEPGFYSGVVRVNRASGGDLLIGKQQCIRVNLHLLPADEELPLWGTTTTLASSPNPSVFGQSVTFTATVTSANGAPTGYVAFKDGGGDIVGCGAQPLSGGQVTCTTTSLGVGAHAIIAQYGGGVSFNSSTSSFLTQTVSKANTTTRLTSSPNPSAVGQSVTFTATVTSAGGAPSGYVAFKEGFNVIAHCAAQPLRDRRATCTTASLAIGAHTIDAWYSGDRSFNDSRTSFPLIQRVRAVIYLPLVLR